MKSNDENNDKIWNRILYGRRGLSDEEAEEMLRITKKLREEWGFRKRYDF